MQYLEVMEDKRQTAPANAINMLKARVFFSALSSALTPLRIPIMIARMTISPAEEMAKDTFDIRLRESESSVRWSSKLGKIGVKIDFNRYYAGKQ